MSITYKSRNTVEFHYTVWRNNVPLKEIEAAGPGTLTMDVDSELKTSFRGTFWAYSGVNFISDRLHIDAEINGESVSLGIYCVTTETPTSSGGLRTVQIEAYSLLWILSRCRIEERTTYSAGTLYTSVIQGLIQAAGLSDYYVTPSSLTLATDREDWDLGTDYLTIINDLLGEMNYNTLFVTAEGQIRAEPYTAPTISGVTHTYTEGRDSLILADYQVNNDFFDKANVFICICDNPELPATLRAESVNADPNSPYSTVNLGRRVPSITYVDNTPSQTELQSYADRLNAESKRTNEVIEYWTAIMPDHGTYETIMVSVGGISGVYRETGFEIALSADGRMKHTAERVIV